MARKKSFKEIAAEERAQRREFDEKPGREEQEETEETGSAGMDDEDEAAGTSEDEKYGSEEDEEEDDDEEPGPGDAEKDDEDEEESKVRIIEDEEKEIGYTVKQKPKLDDETRRYLELRAQRKKKEPRFLRQEWHRYKRLGKKWRRPTGLQSKMRKNLKYRPSLARVGYGTPRKVRGLHPSGFREIMVYNTSDLEKIDPDTEAARVGGSVGRRKLLDIYKTADEKNIRILNRKAIKSRGTD